MSTAAPAKPKYPPGEKRYDDATLRLYPHLLLKQECRGCNRRIDALALVVLRGPLRIRCAECVREGR